MKRYTLIADTKKDIADLVQCVDLDQVHVQRINSANWDEHFLVSFSCEFEDDIFSYLKNHCQNAAMASSLQDFVEDAVF